MNTATTPQVQNYGVATSLPVFGDTTTTAGGLQVTERYNNFGGTVTLTAGGAGTTVHWSSNQHINNQMINEEDTCPGCVCPASARTVAVVPVVPNFTHPMTSNTETTSTELRP